MAKFRLSSVGACLASIYDHYFGPDQATMALEALNSLWWIRLKKRKTQVLNALQTQDFTYLDLPDALRVHTTNPKEVCRQAHLPEAVANELRDRCIDTCKANKEILAAAKEEARVLLGEKDGDLVLYKLDEMCSTALRSANKNIEKIYDFAERLIDQFPDRDEHPGYDLKEDMTDLFIHTAYWVEYSFRGLSNGLRHIKKRQGLLSE